MKLIEIIATNESIDVKKNTLTYASEVTANVGILLQSDKNGDRDMMIIDQVHQGGPVVVKMKPIRTPARKYNVGEVVAILMVNE